MYGISYRPLRWGAIALLAVVVIVTLYYAAIWTLTALAMRGYVWDSTRYSPGYSETRFNSVAPGATKEEVRARLGLPICVRTHSGAEWWYYSRKGPYGWRMRAVVFQGNRVSKRLAEWVPG